MAAIYETRFRVRSYELDALGHVNHAVYPNYFEQARVEALEEAGYPWQDMIARGWLFNVARLEVDYRREARLGDTLRITTTLEEMGRTSMTLRQRALRDGEPGDVVAEARVVGVLVGREGRPIRVPDELREAVGAAEPANDDRDS